MAKRLGWPRLAVRVVDRVLCGVLVVGILLTTSSCATMMGRLRAPSPTELALKVALRAAIVAVETLPKLIERIADRVGKQRQREKHLKAVAAEVFRGECLSSPVLSKDQEQQLQTLRESGAGVLLGGLKMLANSQPKTPRELLVGVALLTEAGLSRPMLEASVNLAQATLKVMGQLPGNEGPQAKLDVAMLQYLIGTLQTDLGQLPQAEGSLQESLKLRKQVLGEAHLCIAQSEHKLGNLYVARGNYQAAESLYVHALDLKKAAKEAGPTSVLVADALIDLADYHTEVAHYDQAMKVYREAAKIFTAQADEKGNPRLADIRHGQGRVSYGLGDQDKAERAFVAARDLRVSALEKALAEGVKQTETKAELRRDLAVSYDALGNLYLAQGSFQKAKEICEQAVEVAKAAVYGDPTPEIPADSAAKASPGPGSLLPPQPKTERAGNLEQSKIYAALLAHCGDVYRKTALDRPDDRGQNHWREDLTAAGKKYAESSLLRQELYKKEGPNVFIAESLLNEAGLHRAEAVEKTGVDRAKDLELAEKSYQQALKIQKKALGAEHPRVAETRIELGELYRARGNPKKSEEMLKQALKAAHASKDRRPNPYAEARIREELAAVYLSTEQPQEALLQLGEAFALNEKYPLAGGLRADDERLDAYLATLRRQEAMIYSLLLNPLIAAKALPLAFQVALSRKGRSLEETASNALPCADIAEEKIRDKCDRQKLLLQEYSSSMLNSQSAGEEQRQGLLAMANKAHSDRAALMLELGLYRTVFAIANSRPAPDRIVHDVAAKLLPGSALVEVVAFHPFVARELGVSLERSYVALVLLPGGAMKHVVLGTGVEKQVEEFRAQVGRKKSRRLNGKSPAEVAEKQAAQQAAQALHALIMKPLAAVLGESRKLYLSVDYQLNLVPFWALYDPEKGQYLIDSDYRFVYLTTGRDLLKADVPNEAIRPQRVAVFAVPQLAKDGGWSSDANGKLKTNQDLQAVKKQFPNALPFTGAWFSKAELLHQKEPPAILHVASHGSFVSNRAARASAEAAGSPAGERDLSLERDCVTPSTDPMLNLRIALSGAKRYCAAGDPSAGTGYATATDLSTMDLRGTQLVVLAAGETGLGTEKPGQGVYGMRRALTLAGSETQILSLWNAYDPAAGLLWTKYYKRLHAGADRVEALRASARELKATPGMEHPYYWGVFIAAGKDGPLRDVQEIASYKDPEALRLAGKAPGGLREVRSSKVVQSPRGRLASGRAPRSAKRPAL